MASDPLQDARELLAGDPTYDQLYDSVRALVADDSIPALVCRHLCRKDHSMTTTDRDDLYRPLYRDAIAVYRKKLEDDYTAQAAVRAVVDLVLDSHPAECQPWEVLREAAQIYERRWPARTTGGDLRIAADRLEAEHRAAQEKAAADAKREKLIEKTARVIAESDDCDLEWDSPSLDGLRHEYRVAARALADAGLLTGREVEA